MSDPAPADRAKVEPVFAVPGLLLSAIVDSAEDAILSKDLNGIITSWNKSAERIFGYTANEIVGKPMALLIPAERRDEEPEVLDRVRRGERVGYYETVRRRKNGELIDVSVTVSPIKDASGSIVGASRIARDITEQKRSQRSLEVAYEELARWERSGADFLSTLSHELRSPLNSILGWVQLLKEGPNDPADLAEGLGVIEQSIRNQTKLIDDLLDISRVESGHVTLEAENLDIGVVVRAAIESVRAAAEARQVRFLAEFSEARGVVRGDGNRLQQVIRNLLSNAVKFSPIDSCVTITISQVDSNVEIAISDSGQGIAPQLLTRIFERFQSDAPVPRRQRPGLGFGLYIARQLIQMHGGEVRAQSPGEGLGATFIVSLPLIDAPIGDGLAATEEKKVIREDTERKVSLHGIKVLTVDDEPDAVNVLKRILESRDATVLTAGSMEEALSLVSDFQPHILLSDIGMPHHDGYELVRRLHCMTGIPFIPAVALTAFARSEDRARALRAGFQLHISKPIDAEELIAVVSNLTTFRRN